MPNNPLKSLEEYVGLVVERRMREADISDGSKVPHGSKKHIKDLEARIAGLSSFRAKQKKGSEARANYSRLISRLKGELASARRAAEKGNLKEVYHDHQDEETALQRWEKMARGETSDDMVRDIVQRFKSAPDPKALGKVKRDVIRLMDSGMLSKQVTDGFVSWLYDQRKSELASMDFKPRSAKDARADRILNITDSSGKKTARKLR
jgi:hypothetical protein